MGTEEGDSSLFMTEADHERGTPGGRMQWPIHGREDRSGVPARKKPKPVKLGELGVQVKGK